MATHSSVIAWRIPWTEEPGGLQSMGSQRVVVSKEKPRQVPRFGISEGKHTGTPSKAAAAAAKLLQSCPSLCDPIDGSPPGSSIHGIFQARVLEWVPQVMGSTQIHCSVAQLCPTLCNPMDCSTPGLPVLHHLLELTQTHIHRLSDAIQPSHPLLSPSPPAFNLSQHWGLFQ